jgi:hypothetical protein
MVFILVPARFSALRPRLPSPLQDPACAKVCAVVLPHPAQFPAVRIYENTHESIAWQHFAALKQVIPACQQSCPAAHVLPSLFRYGRQTMHWFVPFDAVSGKTPPGAITDSAGAKSMILWAHTPRRTRPRARRAAITARPPLVFMRTRKP